MMVFYIVEIAITALMPVASIRFARTGTFAEAFNFSAIFATIGGIGWLNYIIALVLVYIVVSIPIIILIVGFILVGGASLFILKEAGVFLFLGLLVLMILLILALSPLFGVFQARYMTRLYDSADTLYRNHNFFIQTILRVAPDFPAIPRANQQADKDRLHTKIQEYVWTLIVACRRWPVHSGRLLWRCRSCECSGFHPFTGR